MPDLDRGAHWHRPCRMKTCIRCGEAKGIGEFYSYAYTTRQGKQSTRYESRCEECARARRRAAYLDNGEKDRAVSRDWKRRNRERLQEYSRERQADPEVRRQKAFYQRMRDARKRGGAKDSDPAIREIYAKAKLVEDIIRDCPVFDLPELGKKIHVDHKMPLARGGRHEVSNLQLLPAGINLRKWAHA